MEDNNPIGSEGKSVNLSSASRAINIEPDLDQLKMHDEYPGKRSPLFYFTLLLTIAAVCGTFELYKSESWVWGTLLLIVSLILAFLTKTYANPMLMKRIAYESGLLVPAIIINTTPLELIALADMRSSEELDPILGCIKVKVKTLPHHQIKVGEKVPCVALFGMAEKGYRRHFEPRPVAWGYRNANIIAQAIESITNDEMPDSDFQNEWEMLYALADQMKTAPNNEARFFDENLEPVNL